MVENVVHSCKEGSGVSQRLLTFITAVSGVSDEGERARLTATCLPSFVPCHLSGVALLDEGESGWSMVVERDGQRPASTQTEELLTDMELLFHESLRRSGLLIAATEGETKDWCIPPNIENLGVQRLAIAPLFTLRNRLGILFVGRPGLQPFSQDDELVLLTLAEHLAIGIENIRLRQALQQYSEKLVRQNELILGSAGEGISGLDTEGRFTFVNPAAVQMLGWTTEEILGEPVHELLHHTKPDGSPYPREDCPIYAAFRDGQVHSVGNEMFWRKDGSSFPVEYTSTPIREHGRLVGAVVVFRNLSELKRSEEELRRALLEIKGLKDRLQAENIYLQEEIRTQHNFEEIVGESAAIKNVLMAIKSVAHTEANVLITGETGTGKELVARAVHNLSARKDKTLIKVNCASIPRELFESEFFGHVKGSFTGALRDRVGRFELADKGTLFLDEVGEIPNDMQSKLLRVLQEGQFERVGEERTRKVDVRIIAATNRDLKREMEGGRFRQDLYYRLNVFPIEIAPLRLRKEDIPLLAAEYLKLASKQFNCPGTRLSRANVIQLQSYDWPGNVRELRNVIERAVITSQSGVLHFHLPNAQHPEEKMLVAVKQGNERDKEVVSAGDMKHYERENIRAALSKTRGKVYGSGGAAELLGMKPTTLAYQIKKLGLKKPF